MIVFIPIKENSQRVSRKNFRIFEGEPLYKHTLLKYSLDQVYVDTDSVEIYEGITKDARLENVTVFNRSKHLVGDDISVCDLIMDFINRFEIRETIAQIHVTSPFLDRETVSRAHSFIGNYDSVVSCTKHNSRFWRKENYGYCPVNHNPMKMQQTQDLPEIYEENSAFYVFKPETVMSIGNRIGKNPYFYEISFPNNIDIDDESDWQMCKEISE